MTDARRSRETPLGGGGSRLAPGRSPSAGLALLIVTSLVIGLVSLRYALPDVPAPAPLPNFVKNHGALVVHATSAAIALMLGPFQFVSRWRTVRPAIHRWIGRTYLGFLAVADVSAFWIAFDANFGMVSTLGFLGLAATWLVTGTLGFVRIREGDVAAHRRWMIRCFAATAAGITLRFQIPIALALPVSMSIAYPIISWTCWVPNMVVAEWWLRRPSRRAVKPRPAQA